MGKHFRPSTASSTLTIFLPHISCIIYRQPLLHHYIIPITYILVLGTYTGGRVPNDLHRWDYPLFFIFHFILFLYTLYLPLLYSYQMKDTHSHAIFLKIYLFTVLPFSVTLPKIFIDYIQNMHMYSACNCFLKL